MKIPLHLENEESFLYSKLKNNFTTNFKKLMLLSLKKSWFLILFLKKDVY